MYNSNDRKLFNHCGTYVISLKPFRGLTLSFSFLLTKHTQQTILDKVNIYELIEEKVIYNKFKK